jgi:hypothetical protein
MAKGKSMMDATHMAYAAMEGGNNQTSAAVNV